MPDGHLVQVLLPLADNEGRRFPPAPYAVLARELTERFGGVTVHSRGPAQGFWQGEERTSRDDIVVVEVMVETLDEGWWSRRREALEREFRQDSVVVRALPMRRL